MALSVREKVRLSYLIVVRSTDPSYLNDNLIGQHVLADGRSFWLLLHDLDMGYL